MASYEITAQVSGLVCFLVTAGSEDEARKYAEETWAMNVGDIQCCELENLDVELET